MFSIGVMGKVVGAALDVVGGAVLAVSAVEVTNEVAGTLDEVEAADEAVAEVEVEEVVVVELADGVE